MKRGLKIEPPEVVELLAEETTTGGDDVAALPGRLGRYSLARHRAVEHLQHIRQVCADKDHPLHARVPPDFLRKMGIRLADCGSYLEFHHYYTVDQVRLANAYLCRQHLICPLCAIRRGAKLLKAYLERIERVLAERPELRPYFVTTTVKNGEDLYERVRHLRRSLGRLLVKRRGTRQRGEAQKAAGGVYSIEVTEEGRGYHPHAHSLWLCEDAPSQVLLSEEWHDITGDSFIVDVQEVTGDVVRGLLETFKYAVKPSVLSPEVTLQAAVELRRQRLVSSFGCLFGIEEPEDLGDELLDALPYVELLYRFVQGVGYEFARMREAVA